MALNSRISQRPAGERFHALALFAVALVIPLLPVAPGTASRLLAQSGAVNGIFYSSQYACRIPFEMEPGARRLQEIQLYVSEDQGQSWRQVAVATQEQRGFDYRTDRDGMYWFTVRTIDMLGRAVPLTPQNTRPQLKVYIDTRKPILTLRARPSREGMIAVEWEIHEENLDPANFYLEFRPAGGRDWIPLSNVEPAPAGERTWSPGTNGAVEVRLRVRDLARNEGVAQITVTPGGNE